MATKTKVDYPKIYEYLTTTNHAIVSASQIAYGIGVERIYGGTMTKLVRDGYLSKTCCDGLYHNIKHC